MFARALESGGVVRAINAGAHELPRSALDELTEQAKGLGAKGLVWAYVEEGGGWRSPIAKFLSGEEVSTRTPARPLLAPLPHPSGASRWLNAPQNRALLEAALRRLRPLVRSLLDGKLAGA